MLQTSTEVQVWAFQLLLFTVITPLRVGQLSVREWASYTGKFQALVEDTGCVLVSLQLSWPLIQMTGPSHYFWLRVREGETHVWVGLGGSWARGVTSEIWFAAVTLKWVLATDGEGALCCSLGRSVVTRCWACLLIFALQGVCSSSACQQRGTAAASLLPHTMHSWASDRANCHHPWVSTCLLTSEKVHPASSQQCLGIGQLYSPGIVPSVLGCSCWCGQSQHLT